MISNEGREFCRGIGLLAEHIICMADSFEEPIEKFRKSLFYSPEFEDKGKIIQDNIDTANRIRDEVKLISINDLAELHDTYGIALVEYADLLADAVRAEPSPHTNAPAPWLILMSKSKPEPRIFSPRRPSSLAWLMAIVKRSTASGYSART